MSFIVTVIPAYNEGDTLPRFLNAWARCGASRTDLTATAIIVDDGSAAPHEALQRRAVAQATEVLEAAGAAHRIAYLRAPRNQGKGASIRWGWSVAEPDCTWLGFIDADGAVAPDEYWRLAGHLPGASFDALCGSRVRTAGRSVERSFFRHVQGRSFAALVEALFDLGFHDTQCGVKFFRAAMLRPLLAGLREQRWLLDVELLVAIKAAGGRALEMPIDCHERGASALVFGLDPLRMLVNLLSLRARLRRMGDRRP